MDLGIKQEAPKPIDAPVSPDSKEPKVSYPSYDVRDAAADELRKQYGCDVDVEGTAKIKFRIAGNSKDQYSNRVTIEVQSMDDIHTNGSPEGDVDDDEETDSAESTGTGEASEEEKTLGYKRPVSKKESPPMTAKDLEY